MSEPSPEKTVWILGAGFSRFLGGPLMDDILHHRSLRELHIATEHSRLPESDLVLMEAVTEIFKDWKKESTHDLSRNAERFIELLDLSTVAPHSDAFAVVCGILEGHIKNPGLLAQPFFSMTASDLHNLISSLRDAAIRTIVLNTSSFLRDVAGEEERMLPYRIWASLLDHHHSILTFNYDGVLAMLDDLKPKFYFWPLIDRFSQRIRSDLNDAYTDNNAIVYRLHGSLDYMPRGRDLLAQISKPDLQDISRHLIGLPGKNKAERIAALQNMWDHACESLTEANRIIVVGYSFPATDMMALSRIYRAIAQSTGKPQIVLVLGGDSNASVKDRITRIMQNSNARDMHDIEDTCMYAEEFFLCYPNSMPRLRNRTLEEGERAFYQELRDRR